jgi:hypothetical protein
MVASSNLAACSSQLSLIYVVSRVNVVVLFEFLFSSRFKYVLSNRAINI